MAQLSFQQKQFLWGWSKTRFYRWLTVALWVLSSVFNLGIPAGLDWQQLWYIGLVKKIAPIQKGAGPPYKHMKRGGS